MNFKEDKGRGLPTRRDVALLVAMLCFGWLAVVGAVRVGSIVWGWLS